MVAGSSASLQQARQLIHSCQAINTMCVHVLQFLTPNHTAVVQTAPHQPGLQSTCMLTHC